MELWEHAAWVFIAYAPGNLLSSGADVCERGGSLVG